MRKVLTLLGAIALMIAFSVSAEITVGGVALVQAVKASQPKDTSATADLLLRGEPKFVAKNEKGVTGLIQLRYDAVPTVFNSADLASTLRQAYFQLPVFMTTLTVGRWYESYTPGTYFGRYLLENPSATSGSFATNYTVVNGLKLLIPVFPACKTDINLALMPIDRFMDAANAMLRVSCNPIEPLKVSVGGVGRVIKNAKDTGAREKRFSATASYNLKAFVKDLGVVAEYGICNMDSVKENSFIMAGVDIPTASILDQARLEVEHKSDRKLAGKSVDNFAWTLGLVKKAAGLKFNLNLVSDSNAKIGSKKAGDIGAYLRTTAEF